MSRNRLKTTRGHRRSRGGTTLVEMVAIMSVLSLLLGLICVTLHSMVRAEQRFRAELSYAHALEQLADAFRADAHAALSATLAEAGGRRQLSLQLPAEVRVEYRAEKDRIVRLRTQGQTQRQEVFRLPPRTSCAWQTAGQMGQPVKMTLHRRMHASPSSQHETRVIQLVASLGLDNRFARPVGTRELQP